MSLLRVIDRPPRADWPGLVVRPTRSLEATVEQVRPIVEAVRTGGDAAVRRLTQELDGVLVDDPAVPADELRAAADHVAPELQDAIRIAIRNLERFHATQRDAGARVETTPGVTCWRRNVPIRSVGLYVPGGTAPLFSTVLMLGVPARLAGCPEIVLCSPPGPDGRLHPAILFAASELGIDRVFRIGGAQAIAAMAWGTESVPRVDKLFGPGNQYVTAAKQLASLAGVAVDLPAGPTELAVLADAAAPARFVAADLLAQAEHGPDSQVFLVTTDASLPGRVESELGRQLADLPRADIARRALEGSRCVVVGDMDEAIALVNAYAPEHLVLAVDDAEAVADRVEHAGSVFVGPLAPEAAGDYASGTNHTLPTGGAARGWSGVSLDSFVRKITFQALTADGLRRLGPAVETMARAESLEGHARSVSARLDVIGREVERPHRAAEVTRRTNETDIRVRVDLDGTGRTRIRTGLGFFDHMLEQIGRHGGIDLDVTVRGDLHVDEHHTIEDTALALGACLRQALGDKRGIERYGFLLPMDEALAQVALDLSGRAYLVWDVPLSRERVGDVPTELFEHFFRSFCDAAACTLNVRAGGENEHHVIESVFKGVARALGTAVRQGAGGIPSTKGSL
jgi:histidinol dehydrogenase